MAKVFIAAPTIRAFPGRMQRAPANREAALLLPVAVKAVPLTSTGSGPFPRRIYCGEPGPLRRKMFHAASCAELRIAFHFDALRSRRP
jgi:hypothetical protein